MARFIVKFKDIKVQTPRALLLLGWNGQEVWLPKKCIWQDKKYTKGVAIIMPQWLYEEKQLDGKPYEPYHRPDKIAPIYGQEAIDELKL